MATISSKHQFRASPFIIGIDVDDTLLPTARHYHQAMWRCGQLLDEALGLRSSHPKEIIEFQQRTDMALIEGDNFAVDRFPNSWALTYDYFAKVFSIKKNPVKRRQIVRAAQTFSRGPFRAFPGVVRALAKLRNDGHTLHCITAGKRAEHLQYRKLHEAKLASYFTTISVTGFDKSKVMSRIFNGQGRRCLMVGDSLKHDIAPAKKLGVRTVHIPSTSWSFMKANVKPTYTLRSFAELPKLLQTFS